MNSFNKIIVTPECVRDFWRDNLETHKSSNLIATSGGFDPCHIGHIRCLQEAASMKNDGGALVVIVNGDSFLLRKKGYVFMPLAERLEMIAAIKGIDFVVPWDDGSQFVTGALEIIRPNIFAKGGDRSSVENVPEYDACQMIGCTVVFGVGGTEKLQSSSWLTRQR